MVLRFRQTFIHWVFTDELYSRNLSDSELIAEFYWVDIKLQETLDNLLRYDRGLTPTRSGFEVSGYSLRES